MKISNNENYDIITQEERDAMNCLLRLPSDMQAWDQQRQKQAPKLKSASMTRTDKNRNVCTRCNGVGHSPLECPFTTKNLLAPSN